jgi:RNA polymerase sigma-70 factor (ECF subfamily)
MNTRQTQFEALVNAYSTDLFRYAVWLVRDSQLAEDLVQETFMRAWKAIDTLRDPALAKTWLITILRRERARVYEKNRFEKIPSRISISTISPGSTRVTERPNTLSYGGHSMRSPKTTENRF